MAVEIKKREIQITSDRIEAGELANEIGKFYMKDLDSAIESHKKFKRKKLYFVVQTEKDPTKLTDIHIRIGIVDIPFPELKESTDFWEYDYINDKKKLLWSVPHRTDMKNFLRSPDKYNKEFIDWIKLFLKQHPEINLKDKSRVILQ